MSSNPTESFQLANKAAGSYPFTLQLGGQYQLAAHATWSAGSLTLQQLMPDGVSYVSLFGMPSNATPNTYVATLAADGVLYYTLPPGSYQLVFATGSALSAAVTSVPY